MSERGLSISKAIVAAVWVVVAASLFCPHDSFLVHALQLTFWGLLVVHAIECLIFLPALRASGKPLPGQLLQTLLFGVIHYASIR